MWYEGFKFNADNQAHSAYAEMAKAITTIRDSASAFYFQGDEDPTGDPPRIIAFVDEPWSLSDELLRIASIYGGVKIDVAQELVDQLISVRRLRIATAEVHEPRK